MSHGEGGERARRAQGRAECVRISAMAKRAREGTGKKKGAPDEVDRLFELPPDEFTAARDELAKRVAGEGRAEESRTIKALRRPTVAAWAVNQLVRRRPEDIDELLEAGASIRRAQRKVLSGIRSDEFREASERRRRVVTGLLRRAEEILGESGRTSAATGEAVRSTLDAASLDERSGEIVRSGRLSKELPPPSSFGAVEGLGLVPAPPAEAPSRAQPPTKRGADKEKEEARTLRAQRDEATKEAKGLEEKAAQARRAAIRTREKADRAEARADRLRQEAEQARVEAREASKKAQQAETEATRAQDAADRALKRAERLAGPG